MLVTFYPSQLKNNQGQNFLDQILTSVFHTFWIWDDMNFRRWSDIEAVKLSETIYRTAILEKMSESCFSNLRTTRYV